MRWLAEVHGFLPLALAEVWFSGLRAFQSIFHRQFRYECGTFVTLQLMAHTRSQGDGPAAGEDEDPAML